MCGDGPAFEPARNPVTGFEGTDAPGQHERDRGLADAGSAADEQVPGMIHFRPLLCTLQECWLLK